MKPGDAKYAVEIKAFGRIKVMTVWARNHSEAVRKAQEDVGYSAKANLVREAA